MKNLFLLLAISTTLIFTSCEGPSGPPGPPGLDGDIYLGQVFEVTTDFQYFADTGLQESLINFPSSIVVYESDVVLVYLLEGVTNGDIDIWSQLPQTFFTINNDPNKTLIYSFDHTFLDVNLFLYGNFDLTTLGSNFIDDQTFRIAILPAEYADSNLTMEELMYNLQIDTTDIEILPN